ncbi:MAG TPA: hypothetical protein VMW47_09250 [Verrucomicrobiae bacterium]|nr:hypothetical protein [Verrucomicrobiae bacterium]
MTQRHPRPHARLVRKAMVLLGVAIGLAGAGSGALAQGTPLLTSSQALQVVQAYNVANGQANYSLNTTVQNQSEEGSAAQVDDATYAMLRLQNKLHEGTSAAPAPWIPAVEVPQQTGTPANFLATVALRHAGKVYTTVFLFQKDAPSRPWRVLYEPALGIDQHLALASGSAAQMATPNSEIVKALAGYWLAYAHRPTLPPSLAAGPQTTGLVASLEQVTAAAASHGLAELFTVRSGPWPARTIVVGGGARLTFGTITLATSLRSSKAGTLLVQDSGRTHFPAFVSPGHYARVTITNQIEVAILTPSGGGASRVVGIGGGSVAAAGS